MFGFFGPKKADVIEHWYALVPGFNMASKDFYTSVETALKEVNVPGLDIAFVDFAEGGVLSNKREYLRMTRERLVFDICAAPFGTSFFFSCRFAQIPAVVKMGELLALLVCLLSFSLIGLMLFIKMFDFLGLIIFPIVLLTLLGTAIYVLRNAVAMGLRDLDASLIKAPVIGAVYQAWFRKETYYRHDTRIMYCDTVNALVKARVEGVTGAKGIKLVRFMEYSPLLGELYKMNDRQNVGGDDGKNNIS